MDRRNSAGVYVELSAQQLSAGTTVHSGDRDRVVWHGGGRGPAALGNSGDADLALHGGRVAGGIAAGAVEQFVFQGFRDRGGAGGRRAAAVCSDFVLVAREL